MIIQMAEGKIVHVIIIILFLFTAINEAGAHPGIGLVKDSKGNIYYTDLKNIWKYSGDGKAVIAVPDVHSHELYMDAKDNLYGEHLWYEGEATDTWRHYVWCLRNDGELINVKGPAEGFLTDYSFVRDAAGNMYWVERGETSSFIKRDTTGKNTPIAAGNFNDIRWMHATADGEIYFLDLEDLYRISTGGEFQLLARDLAIGNIWTLFLGNQHSVFGIWLDHAKNIYVAVTVDRCVKRITPAGEVSIVYYSGTGCSPTSGLFDDDGNLWILESCESGVGVQKITMQAVSPFGVWFGNNAMTTGIAVAIILAGLFLKRVAKRK